jgi:uncharacterized 2Fe-2S/4Fe-4S cluster protein (DUF4445 family)
VNLDPITIIFEPDGKRGCFKTGIRLFDAAKELGVEVRSECGGDGTCGKCKIIVVNGSNLLNGLTDQEKGLLTRQEIEGKYRLSCQTKIKEKRDSSTCIITAFIPSESRLGERRIQVKGMEQPVPLNPAIKKVHLTLDRPTISNPVADDERLLTKLQDTTGLVNIKLSYETSKTLSTTLRQANWDITVTILDSQRIIDVEAGDTTNDNYGAAIDIGTSKIVGYIVNLNSGEIISAGMLENPQIQYGEDVLSRIAHAIQNLDNQDEIRMLVVNGINTVIESACWEIPWLSTNKIHEVTVVGNTAMTHLFLGIYPKFLSLSPFTPAVKRSVDVNAREIGLRVHPEGNVHVLPCVAGYVGADAVADVIATGIHQRDEMSLLVDVGTNGEVFLGNKDELLSCSCAAGPAFEGAQIRYGMKAVTGAIEKVKINPKTLDAEYETIGKRKPIGLCGSAMVDTVAELLKAKIISTKGRFNLETARTKRLITSKEEGTTSKSYVVAWKDETAINKDITVSTKDISEIQLAKSALHTGCAILMQRKGITEEDVDKAYIAGAFGNYLNPENAKTIGLIPDIPTEKISFVGNTALAGAKMALTSRTIRELADKLSREIKYVELMTEENFKREFIASIMLPHKDLNKYPSVRKYIRNES